MPHARSAVGRVGPGVVRPAPPRSHSSHRSKTRPASTPGEKKINNSTAFFSPLYVLSCLSFLIRTYLLQSLILFLKYKTHIRRRNAIFFFQRKKKEKALRRSGKFPAAWERDEPGRRAAAKFRSESDNRNKL